MCFTRSAGTNESMNTKLCRKSQLEPKVLTEVVTMAVWRRFGEEAALCKAALAYLIASKLKHKEFACTASSRVNRRCRMCKAAGNRKLQKQ